MHATVSSLGPNGMCTAPMNAIRCWIYKVALHTMEEMEKFVWYNKL